MRSKEKLGFACVSQWKEKQLWISVLHVGGSSLSQILLQRLCGQTKRIV